MEKHAQKREKLNKMSEACAIKCATPMPLKIQRSRSEEHSTEKKIGHVKEEP